MKIIPNLILKDIIKKDGSPAVWPSNLTYEESSQLKGMVSTNYIIHDGTLTFEQDQAVDLFMLFMEHLKNNNNKKFKCGDIETEVEEIMAKTKWSPDKEQLQQKTRAILRFDEVEET